MKRGWEWRCTLYGVKFNYQMYDKRNRINGVVKKNESINKPNVDYCLEQFILTNQVFYIQQNRIWKTIAQVNMASNSKNVDVFDKSGQRSLNSYCSHVIINVIVALLCSNSWRIDATYTAKDVCIIYQLKCYDKNLQKWR